MAVSIGDHQFTLNPSDEEDGLGYTVYWESKIPAKPLTSWGRGEEQLGEQPLPVAMISNSHNEPPSHQQAAVDWLIQNMDEVVKRIQTQCEVAWKSCYYWEGNEMEDDEEYFITGVRVPPGESSDWVSNPRDHAVPALIVFDLEQDWEVEHGFYVILDPVDARQDCWATWDLMSDMGLVYEEDEDDYEDE